MYIVQEYRPRFASTLVSCLLMRKLLNSEPPFLLCKMGTRVLMSHSGLVWKLTVGRGVILCPIGGKLSVGAQPTLAEPLLCAVTEPDGGAGENHGV